MSARDRENEQKSTKCNKVENTVNLGKFPHIKTNHLSHFGILLSGKENAAGK